jgi:hypothetical protein
MIRLDDIEPGRLHLALFINCSFNDKFGQAELSMGNVVHGVSNAKPKGSLLGCCTSGAIKESMVYDMGKSAGSELPVR